MKLKNIFFVIASLAGISLLTIPYVTGVGAEQQFSNVKQQIKLPSSVKLVNEQYSRGWFSSQAKSMFSWKTESPVITLAHTIQHGLLPIRPTQIHSQLHLDSSVYPALVYSSSNQDLVTVDTEIQATGRGISHILMPALTINEDSLIWQWQGLSGTVRFYQDVFAQKLIELQTEMAIPYFQLITQAMNLSVENMTVNTNTTDQVLPSGRINFAHLQYVENNIPIELFDWEIVNPRNTLEGNNLTVTLQSQLKHCQIEHENYGPGKIEAELHNLPANSLQAIIAKIMSGLSTDFSEQQLEKTFIDVSLQHGLSLLSNSPELLIKQMTLMTPHGEIKAQGRFKIDKFSPLAFFQHNLLVKALDGEIKIYLPQQLVDNFAHQLLQQHKDEPAFPEQVEQLVTTWVDNKLLVSAANQYSSHLVLQQGILQINGRSFPLSELITAN